MNQANIIGDTCKDRRIDYNLIDRINRQYERKAKKEALKAKLAKKTETQNPEKETKEQNPVPDIKYIKTPDELRDIKGSYSLQKGIYVIDFEIHVPNGCGLILEPGVEFYFIKYVGITCEGRFEAKGKSGLEVLLTAKDKDKGWKNLYLNGGAEAILDYARFSYGKGRENKDIWKEGGAVLLSGEDDLKPTITINNSCFENNFAESYGGAIYAFRGNVEINENNIFENNSAIWGGAISNYHGDIIINENNRFEKNSASDKGGAIYNDHGDISIKENNIFEKNSSNLGGAIRNYNGTLDIDLSKNIFKNNRPDDIAEE